MKEKGLVTIRTRDRGYCAFRHKVAFGKKCRFAGVLWADRGSRRIASIDAHNVPRKNPDECSSLEKSVEVCWHVWRASVSSILSVAAIADTEREGPPICIGSDHGCSRNGACHRGSAPRIPLMRITARTYPNAGYINCEPIRARRAGRGF